MGISCMRPIEGLMRGRGVAVHRSEPFLDIDRGDVLPNDTAFLS